MLICKSVCVSVCMCVWTAWGGRGSLLMGQGTWFLVHTLDIAPGGIGHGHELPQGTWVQTQGWRRGPIRDSWLDEEKEGATSCPRSSDKTVERGQAPAVCRSGSLHSPSLGGKRIQACALQPPGSCWVFRAVLAGPLQGPPWPPWAAGGVLWGEASSRSRVTRVWAQAELHASVKL